MTSLPAWLPTADAGEARDDVGWMALALDIALASAKNGGGPFGAVVVDARGRLAGVGWNAVLSTHDSTAHAEVVAIRGAQQKLAAHRLEGCTLFTSCEPCIQCYGVVYWSGLARVCAALSRADAEALGFDEGPVSDALWEIAREKRGVTIERGLGRGPRAMAAFEHYQRAGGPIY